MSTKIYNPIFSPSGRLLAAALVVMTILAARLQAQYVSTVISNGLYEPYGATTDPSGNVYVTDAVNNRIVKYVPGAGTVSTLAGLTGPENYGTNNGTGSAARFFQPQGIVYVPALGGLVVVDQGNQLLRFVSLAGAVSNLAGMTGVYGANNGAALGGAQFSYPTGIAVANDGSTLYIADQGNNEIRVLSNNVVSTLAVGGYLFNSPSAVAVDNNSNIWVADSLNQVICVISNGTAKAQVIAGTSKVVGTNDSLTATNALFNLPSGLFWDNINDLLVISDTRNDSIRSLFVTNVQGVSGYAVQTIAGIPGTPGFIDGALGVAEFRQPIGLCVDSNASGYYVVDTGNNALRVLQPTQPPPPPVPVPAPVIGYVTFPLVNGLPSAVFNALSGTGTVFNNAVDIAIEQNAVGVKTYFTQGATGSVPLPATNSPQPQPSAFTSADLGLTQAQVPPSQASPLPDLTIYAISEAPPRPSSAIVSAEIQFVTANPAIVANNTATAVTATLSDNTLNAQILYTLDGNAPTNGALDTLGPVLSGATISFTITSNTTLSVQATAPNFAPSAVVTALFSPTNVVADAITFGFASGEASSQFITAPGQTFIAPVTLTLISSAEIMYTLQFNLAVTNIGGAPVIPVSGSNAFTFSSMLEKPIPASDPVVYTNILPEMFAGGDVTTTNVGTNIVYITNGMFTNLLFTNINSVDLLGVGWLERPPETNLYNTQDQTLITYSQAHDTLFLNSGGEVVVGAFSFTVPTTATVGQQYEIQVGSPSATSDGISTPVLIQTPTNGSTTNGAINSFKIVTVSTNHYLVGDVAPFYWFNAGDFGDGYLDNNDVTETFQTAIYGFDGPDPATRQSDYFDAMDSSNGKDNNYYLGTDTDINTIEFGDHVLAVDDVYVTYRRSLDPSLYWFDRDDTASGKMAYQVPNLLTQPFSASGSGGGSQATNQVASSGPRYITVAADQVQTGGKISVQVPVRVLAADLSTDSLPVTVLMLHIEVDPLDGSPPITDSIGFSANTNLGIEFDSATQGANDYAGVWLNSGSAGVGGSNIIGTLSVTLPSNVTSNSAYLVHFDHFSSSPNGIALFHSTAYDGLITVGNRSGSSWNDGIPDSWRLLWFGTVSNAISAADADPDGDGASNWQEYVAGTDPLDSTSIFQILPGSSVAQSSFTLQWSSVVNKNYTVQSSPSLSPGNWTTLAGSIPGNGQPVQWQDTNATGQAQFYRVLVQ
jgi:hypothetical protein